MAIQPASRPKSPRLRPGPHPLRLYAAAHNDRPPRGGSSIDIESVIASALGIPVESVNDSLEFRGVSEWDSMGHLRLVVALEDALGVAIDDELAIELTSVPAIRALASKGGAG